MTPKEKAKALVEKFIEDLPPLANQNGKLIVETAKQCAIICVEEAEKSEYNVLTKFGFVSDNYTSDYWQQVKEEIEKL
jgi:hypothetical protein